MEQLTTSPPIEGSRCPQRLCVQCNPLSFWFQRVLRTFHFSHLSTDSTDLAKFIGPGAVAAVLLPYLQKSVTAIAFFTAPIRIF